MKSRQETGYSHFRNLAVRGDVAESGNGIDVRSSAASANPKIVGVGDDTNVSPELVAKTAGLEQQRFIANGARKTIVDGAATALFNVACAALAGIGGFIDFVVFASDGVDMQVIAGRAAYGAVNKAGTVTATITYTTAPEAKAVSAGTLTLAFTAAENPADTVEFRVQPTGSLTETTYTIEYNVQPIRGAVTIL